MISTSSTPISPKACQHSHLSPSVPLGLSSAAEATNAAVESHVLTSRTSRPNPRQPPYSQVSSRYVPSNDASLLLPITHPSLARPLLLSLALVGCQIGLPHRMKNQRSGISNTPTEPARHHTALKPLPLGSVCYRPHLQ